MKHKLLPVLFSFVTSSFAVADWPVWQHDNRRTGTTDEQLSAGELKPAWTWRSVAAPRTAWHGPAKWDAYANHRNLPSMRNYDRVFHVIAVGDSVWFGSSADDSVYCLNAETGKERWSLTTDGPVRLAPTWSDGRVYFGSDDGYARCADAETGRLIWKFSPAEPNRLVLNNGRFIPFQPCRTGVVVENGTAWFANALLPWKDAWLCAVDAETGTTDAPQHFVRSLPGRTMEGPPALSSKFLVLPQGRVAPRVFDRKTGKDLGEMVKSGGGSVVVVSLDENIFHGPATDSRRGGFRESGGQSREVVAGLGRGNALAVDGTTSWMLTDTQIIASGLVKRKVLWKAECDCPYTLIKAGDTLFAGGDGRITAFAAKDGKKIWSAAAEGRIFSLAVAGGRLFAAGDTGAVQCFSADGTAEPATGPIVAVNTDAAPVETVAAEDDNRLLGQWAFQRSSATSDRVRALNGTDLILSAAPKFSQPGQYQALELDGTAQTVMAAPDFRKAAVPKSALTAEAWVRIDQPQDWGGIIGIIQDNGNDEHGWVLGYRKNRFSIAVCSENGPKKLTYLTADQDFENESWYHVAGTYDGDVMKLYVNGIPCAESSEQSGDIDYPDRAWFEIGAYHDKDEYFRMRGAVHEVRLYDQALTAAEIRLRYQQTAARFPDRPVEASLASGPWLRFTDPKTAVVRWTTDKPSPTVLQYGVRGFDTTVADNSAATEHEVRLTVPGPRREYRYRIGVETDSGRKFTRAFECDTFFNYTNETDAAFGNVSDSVRAHDQSLLKVWSEVVAGPSDEPEGRAAGRRLVHRGMCLVTGDIEADTLLNLNRISRLRFVVAEQNAERVQQLRAFLRGSGGYGHQTTVHHVKNASDLPFTGNWANVVLALSPSADDLPELKRMLKPDGGTLLVHNGQESVRLPQDFQSADNSDSRWYTFVRPPLSGTGDWSHLYGAPDNSAFAGETLGGATSTDDLEVQWVGRPGPRYQADRNGRKPSPLSTGGRLFLQGLHRIVAVDSFNGTVLWSLEIPDLERFNMPRDCSNWCATRDHVFVAVKKECWKIDAATGRVTARFAAEADSQNPMEWGYIGAAGDRLFGSAVREGSSWTGFWGGGDAGWYDARSGVVTHPICSDRLFCRDPKTGQLTWEYRRGVVLNSTITISGDTMYFVESRNSEVLSAPERRVGDPKLWTDLHLVAVDAATGSPRWEKKLSPKSPQVVFWLAHAAKQLTLVSSANTAYEVTSFSDTDGGKRWTQSVGWPDGKGDHGKAMSRPAIVGDRIFVRPAVLSATDGTVLPQAMPGGGCGTYACTENALFFRSGTVTMWDPENADRTTWSRLRPDCWLSTIPAGGMLLSPEGGGGCSCGSWMETSVGFIPKVFNRKPE